MQDQTRRFLVSTKSGEVLQRAYTRAMLIRRQLVRSTFLGAVCALCLLCVGCQRWLDGCLKMLLLRFCLLERRLLVNRP